MGILRNKSIVIGFEGNAVSVAYCSLRNGVAYIDDALILKDEQLDEFLSKEKTKGFIVVNSFKDFYQDILLVPPADDKLTRKMAGVEVRKKAQIDDPSFIYKTLGDKIVDNKRMQEVFVFAVSADEINHIAERFVRNGKYISAIYHDIFANASQVDTASTESVLCVSGSGLIKNLFLVRNGAVSFIRTAQSIEPGMNDFDVQNVNQTLGYCKQNFKPTPAIVMLAGSLCNNYNATIASTEPMACLPFTAKLWNFKIPDLDYTTHAAAFMLHNGESRRGINLMTTRLKKFFNVRKYLQYSTTAFLLLICAGLLYDIYAMGRIIEAKSAISRKQIPPADMASTLSLHDAKKTEMLKYWPFINSTVDSYGVPEIYKFLELASEIKANSIRISAISVSVAGKSIEATIKGTSKSGGYASMQADYQRFVASIAALPGVDIVKNDIDFKDGSLYIDLKWSDL